MSSGAATRTIESSEFDAWLFDLDGVVTDTAGAHAAAWRTMFDDYLAMLAARDGLPYESP